MRQIGNFSRQSEAHRLASYLSAQGIHAHAEGDGDRWTIWVREEDQLGAARQVLSEYAADPEHARYRDAERAAGELRREELARTEAARRNTVDMRERWRSTSASGRRPLTVTIILLCGALAIASDMGDSDNQITRALLFCDPHHFLDAGWEGETVAEKLVDVTRGQFWRVLTPAFLHGGPMHLLFNMVMLYQLGSMIESRRGTWRLGLMVLVMALFSNLAQALAPNDWGGGSQFLGFSGVVYGMLAYAWMAGRYQPALGMHVPQSTIIFAVTFMVLGVLKMTGFGMANWAHGIGFLSGYVLGILPALRSRRKH